MWRSYSKNERGVSLIEVLIILVIAAIMALFTMIAVMKYLPKYRLDAAADSVRSALKRARFKAMSENNNFVVQFYPGSRRWNIFDDDDNDGVRDLTEQKLYRADQLLPTGIEFKMPASEQEVVGDSDPVTFDIEDAACDCAAFRPSGLLILATPAADPHAVYLGNIAGDYRRISSNKGGLVIVERWLSKTSTWTE